MEDSELLELAARAAGIKAQYSENWGDFSIGEPYSRDEVRWNPLTDDGDALRLAVKLSLEVAPSCYLHDYTEVYSQDFNPVSEPYGGDPLAATRRAIVRAAAEIGKTL